ncbi:MAG: hypothetical protein JWO09_3888 [Bacteroidetes bacterium]|nr:hypothetical protein [Bacteroidota bacterium]
MSAKADSTNALTATSFGESAKKFHIKALFTLVE